MVRTDTLPLGVRGVREGSERLNCDEEERMTERAKLTKRAVDALKGTGREYAVTDTEVRGFYLRVSAVGEKAYGFRYKHRGQTRRMKIGDALVMTATEARHEAMSLRAAVNRGEDPARQRKEELEAETLEDLWHLYLERHATPKKRPRSVEEDQRLWRLHLKPAFGREAVKDLRTRDIERLMAQKKDTPGAANRTLSLLSKMMNLALKWEIADRNPCAGIDRYQESAKEIRPLTNDERARLFEALDHEAESGDAGAALAIELLAFTGARRGEVLNATWDQFRESDNGTLLWALPATNTKQKKTNVKPLGSSMSERLRAWNKESPYVGVAWVFPSPRDPSKPWADLKGPWNRIRARAELPHLRLHDLRHDWISAAVASGLPLEIAGRYAGHANTATTRKYAHLEEAVLQDAADKREEALRAARNTVAADVVPLRSQRPNDG